MTTRIQFNDYIAGHRVDFELTCEGQLTISIDLVTIKDSYSAYCPDETDMHGAALEAFRKKLVRKWVINICHDVLTNIDPEEMLAEDGEVFWNRVAACADFLQSAALEK